MTREEMIRTLATAVPDAKPSHAPRAKTVTAYWSLPALLTSLASAGWGDLHGRKWQGVRSTLHALSAKLNHKTARGETTVCQLADAAGLSERWTRVCLSKLEELGLITWKRGGILRGNRVPSYFTVNKKLLAALVRDARKTNDARRHTRAAEFAKRLLSLSKNTVLHGKVRELPALSAYHSPLSGEVFPPTSADGKNVNNPPTQNETTMIIKPVPRPTNWIDFCKHEGSAEVSVIHSCPDCRYESLTVEELAEYEGELLKIERLQAKTLKADSQTHKTHKDKALESFFSHYYPQLSGPRLTRAYLADREANRVPDFEAWYSANFGGETL